MKTNKKSFLFLKFACILVAIFFTMTLVKQPAFADDSYQLVIEDNADLLTDEEETQLAEDMAPLTNYGHAIFLSIDDNPKYDTYEYAASYYYSNFGNENGSLFIIDMDMRKIYVVSGGANYKTITKSRANTITDNVYRYASNADYYGCASDAFDQIYTLLYGGRIAQPMKYASNAVLAILIALLVNFIIVLRMSSLRKANATAMVEAARSSFSSTPATANFTHETRVYSPVEHESSGGGGGGFSGGGGGGGGGFSGGGGGHSF